MPEALRRTLIRIRAMARKEVWHIRRDPRTLYMALGMPALLVILFGYGVRFDLDHIPVSVVDEDRSATSRQLVASFFGPDDLSPVPAGEDITATLRRNEAAAVIVVPAGLEADLQSGQHVDVQLIVDGSDGASAQQLLAKSEAFGRAADASIRRKLPPVTTSTTQRYNPTGESAMYLLPGTIAYVLALIAVVLTSLAVSREWERGSMEQLFATPVGRMEIIIGKLLPYLGLGLLNVAFVLAAGATIFHLPIRGSLLWIGLASMLFLLGMLGQGLLISVIARNQMVATQMGAFSAMLPSMLLSGFLFPIANLPWPLWLLSFLVPARWFISTLRLVLLKGAGLSVIWPDLLGLVAFATLMLVLSTARFERRIA